MVEVIIQDSIPRYKVFYEGGLIINLSRLGFEFKNAEAMDENFRTIKITHRAIDEQWKPVYGTASLIRNHFNELTASLEGMSSLKREMDLIFRVYDDGIGFRCVLPEQSNLQDFEIIFEETQFRFTDNHAVWWIPADYDSYEHLYSQTLLNEACKLEDVSWIQLMKYMGIWWGGHAHRYGKLGTGALSWRRNEE
ncbi:MAG TPA: hypothetical protein DHW42_00850 [Candidatus Marinimicrobia bacterium]|nr:hypothetical protein [Candidatus Neomarinimicrobiota bacterium]